MVEALQPLMNDLLEKQANVKTIKDFFENRADEEWNNVHNWEQEYFQKKDEEIGKQLDKEYSNYEFLCKLREEKREKFETIEKIIDLLKRASDLIDEIEGEV